MPAATVTDLSVMGVPGGVYTFDPKAPAGEEKGLGPFTDLSVMGVPGGLFSFTAKPAAEATETRAWRAALGVWHRSSS